MAIYHFHDSVISRGKGQSVVAAAAYQSRAALYNERDGETKDYSQKTGQDLLFSGVYVPKDAPDWSRDAEQLWNGVERAEDQHNKTRKKSATLAHNIDLALMAELTAEQNRYALQDFIRETYVRAGHGVQASIHGHEAGGDRRNIHAHLLVSLRTLDGEGFRAQKERTDRRQMQKQLCAWREAWAHTAARHLRRHGHEQAAERMEVGHLDLETQRQKALERGDIEHAEALAREPTRHMGAHATRRERNGYQTERGDLNREIREQAKNSQTRNRWKDKTERELEELEDARRQAEEEEADCAFAEMMQEIREEEQARQKEEEQHREASHWAEVARVKFEREEAIRKAEEEERQRLEEAAAAMRALSAVLKRVDALDPLKRSWESGTQPPPAASVPPVNQNEAGRAFTKVASSKAEPPPPIPQAPTRPTEQQRSFGEAAKPPLAPQEAAAEEERRRLAAVAKDVSALSAALDRDEQHRRDKLAAFERLKRQWEARAAPVAPLADNENHPSQPNQPNRKTELGRSFAQSSTAEQPIPQAPKFQSEQQRAFEAGASPPEQPQRRQQGDGGDDSQTQPPAPQIVNRRRPRAQTAEEMRERQKNRSGRKRTPDRD